MTVKEIERIAEGRFGDDYYYNGDLLPTDTSTLVKWAEFLECSTDYLLRGSIHSCDVFVFFSRLGRIDPERINDFFSAVEKFSR